MSKVRPSRREFGEPGRPRLLSDQGWFIQFIRSQQDPPPLKITSKGVKISANAPLVCRRQVSERSQTIDWCFAHGWSGRLKVQGRRKMRTSGPSFPHFDEVDPNCRVLPPSPGVPAIPQVTANPAQKRSAASAPVGPEAARALTSSSGTSRSACHRNGSERWRAADRAPQRSGS